MPPKVKICGLSTRETVDAAIAGGASHIGLVFFPRSPRNVTVDQAAALAAHAARRIKLVGLFVDPEAGFLDSVLEAVRLDAVQLHGQEQPAVSAGIRAAHGLEVWKAIPVRSSADVRIASIFQAAADLILYDAKPPEGPSLPGGTGHRFDWNLLQGYQHPLPWGLAGGLDWLNLAEAVAVTGAPLVDVSSGVETAPGVKNVDKIAAFLKAAADL
jgi:phosphoribosylanthranilate isomerase